MELRNKSLAVKYMFENQNWEIGTVSALQA